MMIRYNVFDFFLKTLWINIFGQVFPFLGLHDRPENMVQYTNLPGIQGNDIWFFASKYVRWRLWYSNSSYTQGQAHPSP